VANESILVVDDNALNLKLTRALLMKEGYEVRTASDAREAMSQLETFHPRLILMDLRLPGTSGLELTRQLRTDVRLSDVIIVALTAYSTKGDEESALKAGCNGYIAKPIDTRTLPQLLRGFLDAKN
jgi:CheY-like chemotaxis protein